MTAEKVMKQIIIRILAIAAVHFFVMMGCLLYSFRETMSAFDNPAQDANLLAALGGIVSMVLMTPATGLWGILKGSVPDFFQWFVLALNSILWGVAITALLNLGSRCLGTRSTGANSGIN